MQVRCFSIVWDTYDEDSGESLSAEDCGLPTECVIETDLSYDELDTCLAGLLSDKYGFCVNGLDFEIL